MSKMNELSIDHDSYEMYVEEGNNELRKEGAKELLGELVRLGVIIATEDGRYTYAPVDPDAEVVRKFIDLRSFI
ncbi:hypothetical protein UFOVP46_52 [uncultured Caudovirales phage]|uniref:Uncharacterized protein n=1 Tax=uncultured Caudovirales phage TaxID=2100421 RepID=A0A6J5KQQ6_9CAUD|nr:hypothetical protein UFOVP46_52 [uncultured Caudovirales phage]